jgi:hypothetical protein
MVVRVWLEGPTRASLRARLTRITDVRVEERVTTVASDVDDVCAQVRAWLESFLAAAEDGAR